MLPKSFSTDYLKQLELLQFRTKRSFLGSRQGGHISPKKGQGIEFSEYRKYELGDSPRSIDWGVYARTDRLYVKRYLEEQDLSVLLLLDSSNSMILPDATEKWEKARDVALSLAYVALSEHDTVQLSDLSGYISPRVSSLKGIHAISDSLLVKGSSQKGISKRTIVPEVLKACVQVKLPGIAVLFTDCLFEFHEFQRALNILRAKNLLISVIHVQGPKDLSPISVGESLRVSDSETEEEIELSWSESDNRDYGLRLKSHFKLMHEFCHSAGIQFVTLLPEITANEFILKYLPQAGILQ